MPQGISADLIASREGFTREDVDRYALESQSRAGEAQKDCRFSKSLFPVQDPETGKVVLEVDEYPRPETTLEGLATLDPVFVKLGATPAARLDIERAVARLPERARLVFVLHDVEGYRHREVGEALGISEGTSKGQLFRARQLLRGWLEPAAEGG